MLGLAALHCTPSIATQCESVRLIHFEHMLLQIKFSESRYGMQSAACHASLAFSDACC